MSLISSTAQRPISLPSSPSIPKTLSSAKTAPSNHSKAFNVFRSCAKLAGGLLIVTSPILIALYASTRMMKNSEKDIEKTRIAKIDALVEMASRNVKDLNETSWDALTSVTDQLGYALLCTNSTTVDVNTILFGGPSLTPELETCIEFEKAQQDNYRNMSDQLLSQGECQQALTYLDKIVYTKRYLPITKIVEKCSDTILQDQTTHNLTHFSRYMINEVVLDQKLKEKDCEGAQKIVPNLRFGKKNQFITKIAKQCPDPEALNSLIKQMETENKEEHLDDIAEEKIRCKDWKGALTVTDHMKWYGTLNKQEYYLLKIFHACQAPDLKQKITNQFNLHYHADCLPSCFSHEVALKLLQDSSKNHEVSPVYNQHVTPEKAICLNECISKLTATALGI